MSPHSQTDPMYQAIVGLSRQFEISREITKKLNLAGLAQKSFKSFTLAGMGGSALPGDFVIDTLRDFSIPFHVIRDYQLPHYLGKEDLIICSSYSGNTEETITLFQEALSRQLPLIVMAHGGRLRDLATEHSIPFLEIPVCVQPRQALGNFFASLVTLLERFKKLPSQEKILHELASFLDSERLASEKKGQELANLLKGRVPIIYGPVELSGACRTIKIKFNENCKIHSLFNVFPEVNHNEMMGWINPLLKGTILYLVSQTVSARIRQRMDIMEEMLRDRVPVVRLDLKGEKRLLEMFHAVQIGDFASYYLAEQLGVEPAPVAMIEEFKKKLGFKTKD